MLAGEVVEKRVQRAYFLVGGSLEEMAEGVRELVKMVFRRPDQEEAESLEMEAAALELIYYLEAVEGVDAPQKLVSQGVRG